MKRLVQLMTTATAALFAMAVPAFAQEGGALIDLTPPFGAGIIILGAGYGIGKIGAAALESTARQPEAAGDIRTGMIIAAALVEGVTLIALIVCMMN